MVAPLLAGTLLAFIVLRLGALRGVDRYLRIGLAALGIAAVIVSRVGGGDDFTLGYWAIGFVFGAVLHDAVLKRGRSAAK